MEKDLSSLAAEMARVTMCLMNIMGFLASPRVIAKAPALPSREHILEHIEEFRCVLARTSHSTEMRGGSAWQDSEPHILKLSDLFQEWSPEQGISPDIVQAARECLLALGVSEPPEGWDAFEGAEDDSPSAGPRAADTAPARDAMAVAWRFINWASVFVIPGFLAAHDPRELRAEVLQRIDRYLEVIDLLRDRPVQSQDDSRGLLRLEPYALKLRGLLREWVPGRPVSSDIIQTVDACLKAIGVTFSAPDDGS